MIAGLPVWIPLLMALSALFAAVMFVWASAASGAGTKTVVTITVLCVLVFAVQGALGYSGFYLATSAFPPRFIGAAPTTLVLLVAFVLFLIPRGNAPLKVLTLLHTVRIPVEVVLWQLFIYGFVPKVMTFESINLDVLSGLTAPLAAWIGFRGGRVRRAFLIVWNLAALALLFNIVFHAVLSVPTPFQRYGFEQPNVGVLYFPFIWLPAFIVPAVFAAHVWSLRDLVWSKG
jgi:hypothetical protein